MHEVFFFNLFRPASHIQRSLGLASFHAYNEVILKTFVLLNHNVNDLILVHPGWLALRYDGTIIRNPDIMRDSLFFCDGIHLSKLALAVFLNTLQGTLRLSLQKGMLAI